MLKIKTAKIKWKVILQNYSTIARLKMRWKIVNEARRPELAITISNPTSAIEKIVLLENPQNNGALDINENINAYNNSCMRLP